MSLWNTKCMVPSGSIIIPTEWVYYQHRIFQGDSLSPQLFCITLIALSIELRCGSGYMVGLPLRRKHKIAHLFYMDYLKIYVLNENNLKAVLNIVPEYTTTLEFQITTMKFRVRTHMCCFSCTYKEGKT